jgi:hypothetical protein
MQTVDLATMAELHWRRFRPTEYAQIPQADRRAHFQERTELAREQIAELARTRTGAAEPTAVAKVLREMILPGPEPTTGQDPQPTSSPTSKAIRASGTSAEPAAPPIFPDA